MHAHKLSDWHHAHVFLGEARDRNEQPVEAYKARLEDLATLSHVTVEVHRCAGAH